MPVIFNMDGSKMSKRDKERAVAKGEPPPQIDVHDFRIAGYLPEAVINFISLLGWNPGDDREQMTRDELISLFDIDRIGKANAKFDREKLLSFNTDWAARLPKERLLEAFKDYLGAQSATDDSQLTTPDRLAAPRDGALLAGILKVCTGFRTFRQVEDKVRFLFTPDEAIEYDAKAVKKVLAKSDGAGYAMLEFLLPKLEAVTDWSADALQQLFQSVCEQRDAKLGQVAQPVRVAITGSTISPSIHESLSMLGKAHTIARIKRCMALRM
jgi:glutamyl-tRNA synthetase